MGVTLFKRLFVSFIFLMYCSAWAQNSTGASGTVEASQADYWPQLPKSFTNSVIFGVEAGFLVGIAAITGFRRNLRDNFDEAHLFRGMSYGLYTGIILGLYVTYGISDGSEPENNPENPPPENTESSYRFQILPLLSENKTQASLDGLMVNVRLHTF